VSSIGRHGRGHAPSDDGDRFAIRIACARAPASWCVAVRQACVLYLQVQEGLAGAGAFRPAPPQVNSSSGGGLVARVASVRLWLWEILIGFHSGASAPRGGWCANAGDPPFVHADERTLDFSLVTSWGVAAGGGQRGMGFGCHREVVGGGSFIGSAENRRFLGRLCCSPLAAGRLRFQAAAFWISRRYQSVLSC